MLRKRQKRRKKHSKKKKLKAAKQQEDEQIQFNQAILEIEKNGFPRLKAIEEFEKMNEAAKNALLEKFQVQTPYKALKRTTSSTKLTGRVPSLIDVQPFKKFFFLNILFFGPF